MPNDDLISREALIETVERYKDKRYNSPIIESLITSVLCVINNAPSVDAKPVRHGWWEKANCSGFIVCSSCGDVFLRSDWFLNGSKWDYCPNCGAKMDLKEE